MPVRAARKGLCLWPWPESNQHPSASLGGALPSSYKAISAASPPDWRRTIQQVNIQYTPLSKHRHSNPLGKPYRPIGGGLPLFSYLGVLSLGEAKTGCSQEESVCQKIIFSPSPFSQWDMVQVKGLEPPASWSQTMRSTNCATPGYRDLSAPCQPEFHRGSGATPPSGFYGYPIKGGVQ